MPSPPTIMPSSEDMLRAALFAPCETKEHLHRWLKIYLGIDVPDCTVCNDDIRHPPSNSNPMDLLWLMYSKLLANDPDYSQILGFSARGGFKTTLAAILEVLCMLHIRCNVAHVAALEVQARNCQDYVDKYFKRPILREFITSKNKRLIEITKYIHTTDKYIISPVQYQALPDDQKNQFEEVMNWIRIIICTIDGANGMHARVMICVDGDTDISVKIGNKKKTLKARSIFNHLLGKGYGGRKGRETEQEIFDVDTDLEFLSVNLSNKKSFLEYKSITAAQRSYKRLFKVNCKKNHIKATAEHPIYVGGRGFVPVKDLKIGDVILYLSHNILQNDVISSIEDVGCDWVYDFTVKDNNNFIANKILVHNCDELDLADSGAVEEAKMIPESENDKLPMVFYTSTRKYSFGLVQKAIDNADRTGLKVFHWNLIDVTKPCPPERHLPEQPKIKIYYDEERLLAISEEEYFKLADKEKELFDMKLGFSGCLSKCKVFASCQGRLAHKQTSKSPLLKPVEQMQDSLFRVSIDHAKSQYMAWKPSSEGLIYPYFTKELHMLTPAQMANKITGEDYPTDFTKQDLLRLLSDLNADFYAGMDHGYTHAFAVVTAALVGHILYVIDVICVKGLELQERIELCKERLKGLNRLTVYPDNAYPADNKTFRRNGFKMVEFKKDVLAGIESVRQRFKPGNNLNSSLFLLKGDEGCEYLASVLMRYHWKVDAHGSLVEEPDKEEDDAADALRYLGQNVPLNKTGLINGQDKQQAIYQEKNPNKTWMKDKIRELTADGNDDEVSINGKPGGLMYTI